MQGGSRFDGEKTWQQENYVIDNVNLTVYRRDDGEMQGDGTRIVDGFANTADMADAAAIVASHKPRGRKPAAPPPVPKQPIYCQVVGCMADLSHERHYYQRYRICIPHMKQMQMMVDGRMSRWCQQCGRFHDLDAFDGNRRTCRMRLSMHNARRHARQARVTGAGGSDDDGGGGGLGSDEGSLNTGATSVGGGAVREQGGAGSTKRVARGGSELPTKEQPVGGPAPGCLAAHGGVSGATRTMAAQGGGGLAPGMEGGVAVVAVGPGGAPGPVPAVAVGALGGVGGSYMPGPGMGMAQQAVPQQQLQPAPVGVIMTQPLVQPLPTPLQGMAAAPGQGVPMRAHMLGGSPAVAPAPAAAGNNTPGMGDVGAMSGGASLTLGLDDATGAELRALLESTLASHTPPSSSSSGAGGAKANEQSISALMAMLVSSRPNSGTMDAPTMSGPVPGLPKAGPRPESVESGRGSAPGSSGWLQSSGGGGGDARPGSNGTVASSVRPLSNRAPLATVPENSTGSDSSLRLPGGAGGEAAAVKQETLSRPNSGATDDPANPGLSHAAAAGGVGNVVNASNLPTHMHPILPGAGPAQQLMGQAGQMLPPAVTARQTRPVSGGALYGQQLGAGSHSQMLGLSARMAVQTLLQQQQQQQGRLEAAEAAGLDVAALAGTAATADMGPWGARGRSRPASLRSRPGSAALSEGWPLSRPTSLTMDDAWGELGEEDILEFADALAADFGPTLPQLCEDTPLLLPLAQAQLGGDGDRGAGMPMGAGWHQTAPGGAMPGLYPPPHQHQQGLQQQQQQQRAAWEGAHQAGMPRSTGPVGQPKTDVLRHAAVARIAAVRDALMSGIAAASSGPAGGDGGMMGASRGPLSAPCVSQHLQPMHSLPSSPVVSDPSLAPPPAYAGHQGGAQGFTPAQQAAVHPHMHLAPHPHQHQLHHPPQVQFQQHQQVQPPMQGWAQQQPPHQQQGPDMQHRMQLGGGMGAGMPGGGMGPSVHQPQQMQGMMPQQPQQMLHQQPLQVQWGMGGMGGGGQGVGGGGMAVAGGLVAASSEPPSYDSPNALSRLSLKIYNCTPEQLPDAMRAQLQGLLALDTGMPHGGMRPGCTQVVVDLVGGSGLEHHLGRLVAHALSLGGAQCAGAVAEARFAACVRAALLPLVDLGGCVVVQGAGPEAVAVAADGCGGYHTTLLGAEPEPGPAAPGLPTAPAPTTTTTATTTQPTGSRSGSPTEGRAEAGAPAPATPQAAVPDMVRVPAARATLTSLTPSVVLLPAASRAGVCGEGGGQVAVAVGGRNLGGAECTVYARLRGRELKVRHAGGPPCTAAVDGSLDASQPTLRQVAVEAPACEGLVQVEVGQGALLSQPLPLLMLACPDAVAELSQLCPHPDGVEGGGDGGVGGGGRQGGVLAPAQWGALITDLGLLLGARDAALEARCEEVCGAEEAAGDAPGAAQAQCDLGHHQDNTGGSEQVSEGAGSGPQAVGAGPAPAPAITAASEGTGLALSDAVVAARVRRAAVSLLALFAARGMAVCARMVLDAWVEVGVHTCAGVVEGEGVRAVMRGCASLHRQDGGAPLLHRAMASGSAALVRMLCEWAASWGLVWDWGTQGGVGMTPVHVAAMVRDGGAMLADLPQHIRGWEALWDQAAARCDGLTPAQYAAQREATPSVPKAQACDAGGVVAATQATTMPPHSDLARKMAALMSAQRQRNPALVPTPMAVGLGSSQGSASSQQLHQHPLKYAQPGSGASIASVSTTFSEAESYMSGASLSSLASGASTMSTTGSAVHACPPHSDLLCGNALTGGMVGPVGAKPRGLETRMGCVPWHAAGAKAW